MKPEPIRTFPTLRVVVARRAAQRWAETNDARGCPIDLLEAAAVDAAATLARDMTHEEVDRVARSRIDTWEQDQAAEALELRRREQDERERLAYLEKVRREIILTRSDPPPRRK